MLKLWMKYHSPPFLVLLNECPLLGLSLWEDSFSLNNARVPSDTEKNKELLFYQKSLCRIWLFCNLNKLLNSSFGFNVFLSLCTWKLSQSCSIFNLFKEWDKEQGVPNSLVKRFFFFLIPQRLEILRWRRKVKVNNKIQ